MPFFWAFSWPGKSAYSWCWATFSALAAYNISILECEVYAGTGNCVSSQSLAGMFFVWLGSSSSSRSSSFSADSGLNRNSDFDGFNYLSGYIRKASTAASFEISFLFNAREFSFIWSSAFFFAASAWGLCWGPRLFRSLADLLILYYWSCCCFGKRLRCFLCGVSVVSACVLLRWCASWDWQVAYRKPDVLYRFLLINSDLLDVTELCFFFISQDSPTGARCALDRSELQWLVRGL